MAQQVRWKMCPDPGSCVFFDIMLSCVLFSSPVSFSSLSVFPCVTSPVCAPLVSVSACIDLFSTLSARSVMYPVIPSASVRLAVMFSLVSPLLVCLDFDSLLFIWFELAFSVAPCSALLLLSLWSLTHFLFFQVLVFCKFQLLFPLSCLSCVCIWVLLP